MAIPDLRPSVPPPDTPNAIEGDHIVKKFGDFTAVDDVSFYVKREKFSGCWAPMEQANPRSSA